MNRWGQNFKQRGEWVELQFMAEAALHGHHVLTPWGDSLTYDVAIDQAAHLLRVQVKSTSSRRRSGYYCRFRGGDHVTGYDLAGVDLFASYVIPDQCLVSDSRLRDSYSKADRRHPAMSRSWTNLQPQQIRTLPRSLGITRKIPKRPIPPQPPPLTPAAKRRKNAAPDASPG
ncbi:MAG: group I intron-associated PD-(D/E)XK endonuclease [Candidatus Sulfotelmatobacter sp.]